MVYVYVSSYLNHWNQSNWPQGIPPSGQQMFLMRPASVFPNTPITQVTTIKSSNYCMRLSMMRRVIQIQEAVILWPQY